MLFEAEMSGERRPGLVKVWRLTERVVEWWRSLESQPHGQHNQLNTVMTRQHCTWTLHCHCWSHTATCWHSYLSQVTLLTVTGGTHTCQR